MSLRALLVAALAALGLSACKPAVEVANPSPFDEDDPAALPAAPDSGEPPVRQASAAPSSRELRGMTEAPAVEARQRHATIERAALHALLDRGPGMFLRGVELKPRLNGKRFEGWEIVQFMPGETRFDDFDLRPGDVIGPVNGQHLPRPEHLAALWAELRSADTIVIQVRRGPHMFELRFEVTEGAKPPGP